MIPFAFQADTSKIEIGKMEKSIEKNQSSNTREHIDSQKTNRGLVSLKPKGRQREGLGANRIMRVLSTAAEQLGLAVFVAGICDKGMVKKFNLEICSFCNIST